MRYNNAGVQQKFGNNNLKASAGDRKDHRGRDGQKGPDAGKDRAGAGDRGGADRAKSADRAEVKRSRQVRGPRRQEIAPRPQIAAKRLVRQAGAGAIPPLETCRQGARPKFSPHAAGKVLPARALRGPVAAASRAEAAGLPAAVRRRRWI